MRYFCLIFILLWGCSKPEPILPYADLIKGLGEAPFAQKDAVYPYELTLQYRPVWALASRSFEEEKPKDEQAVVEAIQLYQGGLHFFLKVGPHPDLPTNEHKATDIVNYQPDQATFAANLHRLIYGMDDYIYIVTPKGQKVPVSFYQLDRNWGIGTVNRFSLQFPQVFNGEDLAQVSHFQVVIQNLAPGLPESRFDFKPNPVKKANYSPQQLLEALTLEETE